MCVCVCFFVVFGYSPDQQEQQKKSNKGLTLASVGMRAVESRTEIAVSVIKD